jgi:hypothetical protein
MTDKSLATGTSMIKMNIENELKALLDTPFPRARRSFDDFYADFTLYDDFIVSTAKYILNNEIDDIDFSYESDLGAKLSTYNSNDKKDLDTFKTILEYKEKLDKIRDLLKSYLKSQPHK